MRKNLEVNDRVEIKQISLKSASTSVERNFQREEGIFRLFLEVFYLPQKNFHCVEFRF